MTGALLESRGGALLWAASEMPLAMETMEINGLVVPSPHTKV